MAFVCSVSISCPCSATPVGARTGNEVSSPNIQPLLYFTAVLTCPNLIVSAKLIPRALRQLSRGSAQRMIAATGTRLPGRFSGKLFAAFERRNPFFKRLYTLWRFRQRFPNGRFIKDFQNV